MKVGMFERPSAASGYEYGIICQPLAFVAEIAGMFELRLINVFLEAALLQLMFYQPHSTSLRGRASTYLVGHLRLIPNPSRLPKMKPNSVTSGFLAANVFKQRTRRLSRPDNRLWE